jgi:hypothetical protein
MMMKTIPLPSHEMLHLAETIRAIKGYNTNPCESTLAYKNGTDIHPDSLTENERNAYNAARQFGIDDAMRRFEEAVAETEKIGRDNDPGRYDRVHEGLPFLQKLTVRQHHKAIEPCGVFTVVGGVTGPLGIEPPIDAAVFAIPPTAARLMLDLAHAVQRADLQCDLSYRPGYFNVGYKVSLTNESLNSSDVTWPDDVTEALKLGGDMPFINSAEFTFCNAGEIWFEVTTENPPGVAKVYIAPEILKEIAAGLEDSPTPGF